MKKVYIILIVIIIGLIVWYFGFYKKAASPSNSMKSSAGTENWVKNKTALFDNVTSSDTHKLDDGTFRMYFQKDGKIVYAESKDATTFGTPASTGIAGLPGGLISNPAVLKIKDGDWILVYETQPFGAPDAKKEPGPGTQRNLHLATSQDGRTFSEVGIAIDSSKDKDDNYFASVPDLVKTPNNKIRLYYVCGGEAVCSAISDNGKAFIKEGGFRLEDKAVDPDVLYQNGKWIMYFSTLTGDNNRFYKATSSDGLKWTKVAEVLKPESASGAIVDPDVLEISPGKWRMFFGEMANGAGQMGGPARIDLFYADFAGNIF